MNVEHYIQQSMEGLQHQTAAHAGTWKLGKEKDWRVDMNAGTVTLVFDDGVRAVAPIQVIGTYNPENGSFLWGWNHPSVPQPLRGHALLVKEFGEQNGLAQYAHAEVECTEQEAWEFTAVAARLAGANGAYRGNAGGPLVFMTFGEVNLQKAGSKAA